MGLQCGSGPGCVLGCAGLCWTVLGCAAAEPDSAIENEDAGGTVVRGGERGNVLDEDEMAI